MFRTFYLVMVVALVLIGGAFDVAPALAYVDAHSILHEFQAAAMGVPPPTADGTKKDDNLATVSRLDFSQLDLSYEGFRQLAMNPNLSDEERGGFAPWHRHGYEDVILEDISRKLHALSDNGKTVVDIGCGVGPVTEKFIALCQRNRHRLILVDSKEILQQTPPGPMITMIPGMYPINADQVRQACGNGADVVLCYSVLHYAFVDTNLFSFVDSIVEVLKDGGVALIGDVPNVSKRRRFFSSPNGVAFHRAFTHSDEIPQVNHLTVERDKIDDAVLAGLVVRAQAAGCNAYIVPQDTRLPMANRRDDLLILKP